MPHFQNERESLPVQAGFSDEQFAELRALLTELLTPGYHLAKLYLAQAEAQAKAAQAKPADQKASGS